MNISATTYSAAFVASTLFDDVKTSHKILNTALKSYSPLRLLVEITDIFSNLLESLDTEFLIDDFVKGYLNEFQKKNLEQEDLI